ncbi:metallophosphoesterase family protein [Portibacter marinus]|uniref:metallophosphoesterase family protein n=1 Tax=Portibacter marinus TaxID=2898660 RepID=UPI001F362D49|nr:metallophosphoesterase family protein [Portibacter marinus]
MRRIGLLSDTHSYIDKNILSYFSECDEIWHAGDIGDLKVADEIEAFKPMRAVYGNIDGADARRRYPLDQRFQVEGMDVWMTHIGGYPGRYNKRVAEVFRINPPDLFICGHSHIMKVMPDKRFGFLHINPGACGHHGFHKIRTMARFTIDNGKVTNLQAIELGGRGKVVQ